MLRVSARVGRQGSVLVAYLAGTAGLCLVTATLAETLGRQMIASVGPSWGLGNGGSSRAETGLQIQARAAAWQNDDHKVTVTANAQPIISAGAMALAMDNAESAELDARGEAESGTNFPPSGGTVAPNVIAPVQRSEPLSNLVGAKEPVVAGWSRRLLARKSTNEVDIDSPARIIERSLRAEI
jgi:hypothetical protein